MPVPQTLKLGSRSPQCSGPIGEAGSWFHAVVVAARAVPGNSVLAGPRNA
jgi:hypothetical protein